VNRFFTFFIFSLISINSFNQKKLFEEAKMILLEDQSGGNNLAPIYDFQNNRIYLVCSALNGKNNSQWDQNIFYFLNNLSEGNTTKLNELEELNSKLNNGVVGVSQDGKRIYLLDTYSSKKGLSVVEYLEGKLSKPKSIEIPNLKIETTNYGFYVHPDEKTIIISYQGKSSRGLEDLYISNFESGTWSSPKQLNSKINSEGYEISPFLSKDKDTLYFASNGQQNSFGDADIFYSIKEKNGDWSSPINMGEPFNSKYFDAYLIQIDKKFIWTSTRGKNKADLYYTQPKEMKRLKVKFSSKDVSLFNGTDGQITLETISGNPPYQFKWSNGVQVQDLYQLRAGSYSITIRDEGEQQFDTTITINQPELIINQEIRIPQIQYKKDTWEFINNETISSTDSLEKIVQLLTQYPKLVIKLVSHTDCRGDEARNLILAHNRSRACFKYLVEKKGIDPRRVIPVGMGESQPTYINDLQSLSKIEITESYINNFKEDPIKFESLHQLNRRTEGIVERLNFNESDKEADKNYFNYLNPP
jgi:outer membrane protein OmpA-like peptidoglycan-associated protein